MDASPNPASRFVDEVPRHRQVLAGWLRRTFPALSDVENLVQESVSRVWRILSTERPVTSPRALLFATARNLAIDHVRRQRVAGMHEPVEGLDHVVLEDGPTPAEATARNQELELLTLAIQSLPERCRQVLTLRKIYGLSQQEIARRLGIAEHTVEAHIAQGMRRCAHYFRRVGLP